MSKIIVNVYKDDTEGKNVRDFSSSSVGLERFPNDVGPSDIFVVPNQLFLNNRIKLISELIKVKPNSVVFVQGRRSNYWYNADQEITFKQEPSFLWLFGVTEPGFYGALDVQSGKSYLFIPPGFGNCQVCEDLQSPEYVSEKYAVDVASPLKDMGSTLAALCREKLLILQPPQGSDMHFPIPDLPTLGCFDVDTDSLWPIIVKCRLVKSVKELDLIRYVCNIATEGYRYVMKNVSPGIYGFQAVSLFIFYLRYISSSDQPAKLCRICSVESLIQTNFKYSFAHNNHLFTDGDVVFVNVVGSYNGCMINLINTFPINGKFSNNLKDVHSVVENVRKRMLESLKPGITTDDIVVALKKCLINELLRLEILTGPVDDTQLDIVADYFLLKPIFSMIGIDHSELTGLTPITLEPGMALSLHVSCYFTLPKNESDIIIPYLTNIINVYESLGCSIQDILLVTSTGYEILSNHPKEVEEIENFEGLIDFRNRIGKNVDIIEGNKLFPNISALVDEELSKRRLSVDEEIH